MSSPFALGFRAGGRFFESAHPRFTWHRRDAPKRARKRAAAPPSAGAVRILGSDFRKLLFGFLVPEGVHECDATFEGLLNFGGAGDREGNCTEFFVGIVSMVVTLITKNG